MRNLLHTIFVASGLWCLTSCATARFQPVQRDSTYTARVDSVYVLDSVYIDRYRTIMSKADTVYITDTKTEVRYRWRDRVQTDTLVVNHTETKVVEVQHELNWWQRFRLNGFWVLLGIIGLWIAWKIAKIYLHL